MRDRFDLPYGPHNRFANMLNAAWNHNRNPLYQYYRFPFESLFAFPPPGQAAAGFVISLAVAASPLLGSAPLCWTLCRLDFVALIVTTVVIALARDTRPVSERGQQFPWQTALLWLWSIEAGFVPCFLVGTFCRSTGLIG